MNRDYLFHSFFLIAFLALLYQFGLILQPFLTPILGAVVLAVLAYPFHQRLSSWIPKRSANLKAFLSTISVLTVIVVPCCLLGWLLFNESQSIGPLLRNWTETVRGWRAGTSLLNIPWVRSLQEGLDRSVGIGKLDFERVFLELASSLFDWIGGVGGAVARNAVLALWHLFLMSFTLFFVLRDSEWLMGWVRSLVPMRMEHKHRIATRLKVTVIEIVRGSILTAVIQTLCAVSGYWIFGVPAAATLGLATGVASFIPVFGTALVWAPVSFYYLSGGEYGRGILVFVWGALVVATFDNLLRSFLIGRKAELPILFLLFSILGGAKIYGLNGLLMGPLLVAIIPVFVDIYREQYLRKAKPESVELHDDFI